MKYICEKMKRAFSGRCFGTFVALLVEEVERSLSWKKSLKGNAQILLKLLTFSKRFAKGRKRAYLIF